jgi:hypothetical protein
LRGRSFTYLIDIYDAERVLKLTCVGHAKEPRTLKRKSTRCRMIKVEGERTLGE